MSLKVTICGGDTHSDEYKAALRLQEIIRRDVPSSVSGEILLYVSATLFGQDVKDVDLMMIGELSNYSVNADFYTKSKDDASKSLPHKNEPVLVRSFCTTIEVKNHDASSIFMQGTDLYVLYKNRPHCVTLQSNKQKTSAMGYFENSIGYSPYITNLIWFTQITANELKSILSVNGKTAPSNALSSESSFSDFTRLIIQQNTPFYLNTTKTYCIDSLSDKEGKLCTSNQLQIVLERFSQKKKVMGDLTRKRIELITSSELADKSLIDNTGEISIYRGRAGTGKTVGLIQTAIRLVDQEQARVLILTYNRALVSDIRRLFALAELPDMFEEKCVCVDTMHSFFFRLTNQLIYEGKMTIAKYLTNYEKVLQDTIGFLSDDTAIDLARETMALNPELNWEYILIDEAQDWSNSERDLILKLFEPGYVIIADGGNQFVRNDNGCDWTIVKKRRNSKLKYCLRQKENIVSFLNAFSEISGLTDNKIITNGKMLGGRIIITTDDKVISIHQTEQKRVLEAGNTPYDILYLVPYSLTENRDDGTHFKLDDMFFKNGISIWDGTNDTIRRNYDIESDDVRVIQYHSSRGLEGWVVICMDFDSFMKERRKEYVPGDTNPLLLESPEDVLKKYMYNWAMIPLTRAIDTLVITLKDPKSSVGNVLHSIAKKHPDYVEWRVD